MFIFHILLKVSETRSLTYFTFEIQFCLSVAPSRSSSLRIERLYWEKCYKTCIIMLSLLYKLRIVSFVFLLLQIKFSKSTGDVGPFSVCHAANQNLTLERTF